VQELVADAAVKADAAGDLLDVRPHPFAEAGDFIDEGDLGGEEGIGRVFDQLGRFQVGGQDREIAQVERPVDLRHHLRRALVLDADHHPVGLHEILDRRALAQELGVGGNVELRLRVGLGDHLLHLPVGAHRHGGFGHHHGIAGQRPGDLLRGGHHIGQIRMAVAAPCRGADGDEHRLGAIHRGGQIGGEAEPPRLHVLLHQLLQPRLVDRHLARLQPGDLARVLVDADHVMAEIRKTDAGHQSDIAGANHRNAHGMPFPQSPSGRLGAAVVLRLEEYTVPDRAGNRFFRAARRQAEKVSMADQMFRARNIWSGPDLIPARRGGRKGFDSTGDL